MDRNLRMEYRDKQTYEIIGAAIDVHQELGPGFLERVYQEALAVEMRTRGIPFAREVELQVAYKGQPLPCLYRADFICYDEILVEIKAIPLIGKIEEAQVINYLKATSLRRALLLNFGAYSLQHKRMVYNYGKST